MKSRVFDPQRLEVTAFAGEGQVLEGDWPLAELPRLAEMEVAEGVQGAAEAVHWRLAGEARPRRGADAEVWLHVRAGGAVWLPCQRCLQPMRIELAVDRAFRLVRSEAEAEAEDPDSEEDVLVGSRAFDARALIEDELILALPLVPRHDECPQPLPLPLPLPDDDIGDEPAESPFAQLAALKRGEPPAR